MSGPYSTFTWVIRDPQQGAMIIGPRIAKTCSLSEVVTSLVFPGGGQASFHVSPGASGQPRRIRQRENILAGEYLWVHIDTLPLAFSGSVTIQVNLDAPLFDSPTQPSARLEVDDSLTDALAVFQEISR